MDPLALRREQYADDANLRARIRLHAKFSVQEESWPGWLLRYLQLPVDGRVLDLGCGNGRLWEESGEGVSEALEIVLCDLSAGMLARARRVAPPGSRAVQASALALPYRDREFDRVLALHMLYHLPDLAGGLAGIRRALVPGGLLLASTNGRGGLAELDALLVRIRPRAAPGAHALGFSLENGEAALAAAGFERIALHRYPNHLEVTDAGAVVDYVASMEEAEALTPQERSALRETVQSEIDRHGHFHVTIATGVFEALRPWTPG